MQSRKEVLEILCSGLARQEYRGYDSAGLCVDGDKPGTVVFFKEVGKVAGLRKKIATSALNVDKTFVSQVSIAHTRWATHGPPSERNCHPIRSDPNSDFVVVHNGIVTNSAELRLVLEKRGYKFETETDTEAVAILTKYVYDSHHDKELTFTGLIKAVLKELEGSFAFVFRSRHYPNEVVTARRGSPLLIGVKTDKKLKVDFVDVEFAGQDNSDVSTRELLVRIVAYMHAYRLVSSTQLPQCAPCRPFGKPQGPPYTKSRIHVRRWPSSAHRILHRLRCCCHRRAHQTRSLP